MSAPSRARPSHATANDAALDLAGVECLAAAGWDGVSVTSISDHAGLTSGAFYARYPGLSDLAESLWQRHLRDELATAVAALSSTVEDPERLISILATWADPTQHRLHAAVELAQASQVDRNLDSIRADARRIVDDVLLTVDPTTGAARATALALGLGLALTSTRDRSETLDLALALPTWAQALAKPVAPRTLPPDRADHLYTRHFSTGDARHDEVLAATLDVVGARGYRNASITRICREAGVTSGYLYDRYPSKLDLFLAATRLDLDGSYERTLDFAKTMSSTYGLVVAEAIAWRELQLPDLLTRRLVLMEQCRMARFINRMSALQEEQEQAFIDTRTEGLTGTALSAAQARWHVEIALGMGLNLVSILGTDTWSLPWDAVVEPLLDRGLLQ